MRKALVLVAFLALTGAPLRADQATRDRPESAAALANVSPAPYANYEEALFPRAGGMMEKAARELARDVAEAAGAREAFEQELSSGRARERVLRDIELALRLGLNSTPVFFYRGTLLTGESQLAESYIQEELGNAGRVSGREARR
jgi:hypothetical protein